MENFSSIYGNNPVSNPVNASVATSSRRSNIEAIESNSTDVTCPRTSARTTETWASQQVEPLLEKGDQQETTVTRSEFDCDDAFISCDINGDIKVESQIKYATPMSGAVMIKQETILENLLEYRTTPNPSLLILKKSAMNIILFIRKLPLSQKLKENYDHSFELPESWSSKVLPHTTEPDGNCLFNALSLLYFNDISYTNHFRLLSIYTILNCRSYFDQVFRILHKYEGVPYYCHKLARPGDWGDEVSILALSIAIGRPIIVLNELQHSKRFKSLNSYLRDPQLHTVFTSFRYTDLTNALHIAFVNENHFVAVTMNNDTALRPMPFLTEIILKNSGSLLVEELDDFNTLKPLRLDNQQYVIEYSSHPTKNRATKQSLITQFFKKTGGMTQNRQTKQSLITQFFKKTKGMTENSIYLSTEAKKQSFKTQFFDNRMRQPVDNFCSNMFCNKPMETLQKVNTDCHEIEEVNHKRKNTESRKIHKGESRHLAHTKVEVFSKLTKPIVDSKKSGKAKKINCKRENTEIKDKQQKDSKQVVHLKVNLDYKTIAVLKKSGRAKRIARQKTKYSAKQNWISNKYSIANSLNNLFR